MARIESLTHHKARGREGKKEGENEGLEKTEKTEFWGGGHV